MSGPSEKASRAPGMTDGRPSGTGMENEQVVIETEGGGGGAPAKVGWRQKGMKDPCCCGHNKLFCMIFIIIASIVGVILLGLIIFLILFFTIFAKATTTLKDQQNSDSPPAVNVPGLRKG